MDRIVLVRLLAQDCRVHARSLAAASGPTIPRAELARSRERWFRIESPSGWY